jgi:cytochrome d ubiquinol oxidase subunit I
LVISFHIIFPSFTIGLAAWLATLEGVHLATGRELYRRVFDFWLKVFAVCRTEKPSRHPHTHSERALLEATFLGVVLLGRDRVPPWFYFIACCMLALGTMASTFWIIANNSWMQVPVGHKIVDGKIIPSDWLAIVGGPVFLIRWRSTRSSLFMCDPPGKKRRRVGFWLTIHHG